LPDARAVDALLVTPPPTPLMRAFAAYGATEAALS